MLLTRIQRTNMSLTEKNLREKDFHNELQSRPKGKLKIFFIKLLQMYGMIFMTACKKIQEMLRFWIMVVELGRQ